MNAQEKLAQFKQAMESWEASIGLPLCRLDFSELDEILNMDRASINDLSAGEAGTKAFILSQFAFSIQRRENQCRAFMRWAGANDRTLDAANRDRLAVVSKDAECKQERIAFLSRRIEFMAQCLMAVQRCRSKEDGN